MKNVLKSLAAVSLLWMAACTNNTTETPMKTAADILGNPDYPTICFGGYRHQDRSIAPTLEELKEDLLILNAMGIKVLRTYHARLYGETARLLQAITELKKDNPDFEMYVMLGTWMQCENAFTEKPNHAKGDSIENRAEIEQAIAFAKSYPDIIKVIAVGNESMVHWAASYFVHPKEILKWVNHLQKAKKAGTINQDIWITSSDNFASWGGGGAEYHIADLTTLIKAVDYVSVHVYPFHDTHYNPAFWVDTAATKNLSTQAKANAAMKRASKYAQNQYAAVAKYLKSLSIAKPMHIGETGWASSSDGFYGAEGSGAADEYKQKLYYDAMRSWTDSAGISCFFFEAFDEPWKDSGNPLGSENHFGLFTVDGQAKYVLWDAVDTGTFKGLGRSGKPVTKTFGGNENVVLKGILVVATQVTAKSE
jgi:exo-beta-1,3-glucanase (GH17 family)